MCQGDLLCISGATHSSLLVLMECCGRLRDYAKSASATASQSKEEILVLASVGSDECPVGQGDFHLHDIIDAQAIDWCEDAVTAASNPTP